METISRREATAGPYRSAADPSPTYRTAVVSRDAGDGFALVAFRLVALVLRIAFWLVPIASFALWELVHRDGSAAEWFEDVVRWIWLVVTALVMGGLAIGRAELEERANTARGTEPTASGT